MAALREPGIALTVHVPGAEGGKAPLLRRDTASCRRVSAIPGGLSAPGLEAASRQPGLAHSCRQPAQAGNSRLVLAASQSRVGIERRERRYVVGLYRSLSARGHAALASQAASARRVCHSLFPRLRAPGEEVSGAGGSGARGAA